MVLVAEVKEGLATVRDFVGLSDLLLGDVVFRFWL